MRCVKKSNIPSAKFTLWKTFHFIFQFSPNNCQIAFIFGSEFRLSNTYKIWKLTDLSGSQINSIEAGKPTISRIVLTKIFDMIFLIKIPCFQVLQNINTKYSSLYRKKHQKSITYQKVSSFNRYRKKFVLINLLINNNNNFVKYLYSIKIYLYIHIL